MKSSIKKAKVKVAATLLAVGLLLSAFTYVYDELFEIGKNLELFSALYKQVSLNYVEKVDAKNLMRVGIDAMLEELDPYTEFVPEDELDDFRLKYVNTQYSGLGARVMTTEHGNVLIAEIFEGYAAHRIGLRVGDEILRIDGELVRGRDATAISHLLKGEEGSLVKLQIKESRDSLVRDVSVARAKISQPNVSYVKRLNADIGYIKLDKFLANSTEEVSREIAAMQNKHVLNGLILDLRDNGGGILQESVKIVNLFVRQGEEVVTQKGNRQDNAFSYVTSQLPIVPSLPLVILINENSASASEIVAGALQDLDRAVIIGKRSFGKGLVQQTYRLPYNNLVKVTVAKYYTPSGRCIQALDYGHKDRNGKAIHIDDSLIAEFTTKSGRKVYDGNGISPDIEVEEEGFFRVVQLLARKRLIADYATIYFNEHACITDPAGFQLTDSDYAGFLKFLTKRAFIYDSESARRFDQFKLLMEEEGLMDEAAEEMKALQTKISKTPSKDLQRYKREIKTQLEREIVTRYYFERGRYEFAAKTDQMLLKAQNILKPENRLVYNDILTGKGNYQSIGKPNVHFASQRQD